MSLRYWELQNASLRAAVGVLSNRVWQGNVGSVCSTSAAPLQHQKEEAILNISRVFPEPTVQCNA